MTLSDTLAAPITLSKYPSCPQLGSGILIKEEEYVKFTLRYVKDAKPYYRESPVIPLYSILVLRKNEYIFAASFEVIDLRILATLSKKSVKSVQNDYLTKSFFTSPELILYSEEKKEDTSITVSLNEKQNVFFSLLKENTLDVFSFYEEFE